MPGTAMPRQWQGQQENTAVLKHLHAHDLLPPTRLHHVLRQLAPSCGCKLETLKVASVIGDDNQISQCIVREEQTGVGQRALKMYQFTCHACHASESLRQS